MDFTDLEAADPVFGKGKALPVQVKPTLAASADLTDGVAGKFVENCPKCRGSGNFIGYSGYIVGKCNACKGSGKRTFKTAPQQRQKARAAAAAKPEKNWEAFKAADPAAAAWIESRQGKFDFATRMAGEVKKKGKLTEGQRAGVQKCIDKDAEFAAKKAAAAVAVDVSAIVKAFDAARGNGIEKPRMNVAEFRFNRAPDGGKNAGAIYIKQGDDYLGKVLGGVLQTVSACSPEQRARIVEVCATPLEAAIAHGKKTGKCSCCGRLLENAESIALGIGPICMEKYGWT
jgi:hypothetical protein